MPSATAPGLLMTVEETARFCHTTRRTILEWRKFPHDPMPCSSPTGGKILFDVDLVREWLARQGDPLRAERSTPRVKSALKATEAASNPAVRRKAAATRRANAARGGAR